MKKIINIVVLLIVAAFMAGCSSDLNDIFDDIGNRGPAALDVQISGIPENGQVLTGSYTYYDTDGDAEGASNFRWLVSDTPDGDYTPIDGATGIAYTLTSDEKLKYIRFEVSAGAQTGETTGPGFTSGSFGMVNCAWTHPVDENDNISPDGEGTSNPQVAMDDSGNAIIVWDQNDNDAIQAADQVFMSEYRNGSWTHPAGLTDNISPDNTTTNHPQPIMGNNGNALIVWYQLDASSVNRILMSEYRNSAWTHDDISFTIDSHINPGTTAAINPEAAMDNNGNAIIVWQQENNFSVNRIFASEYRNNPWTHSSFTIDSHINPGTTAAINPQAAMDDNGNAIIVWQQNDGSNTQIYMSEYRNGEWSHNDASFTINSHISPDGGDASDPQVAMDNNGNALIIWRQISSSISRIFISEYRNGQWTHPEGLSYFISVNEYNAINPQVAMDDIGNAIIVWHQSDGSYIQIYMSEYRNGIWSHNNASFTIDSHISPDGQSAYYAKVAMDDNGNAVIVWHQSSRILMSSYRNGAWTHPAALSDSISPDTTNASDPQVAMGNNGDAVIVWTQYDGFNDQVFMGECR
jgi:hypothetical protein